jgi:U3 small nucleolar RNA-associated protein 12
VFLEEEKENELEEIMLNDGGIKGNEDQDNSHSMTLAEKIMEALDVAEIEKQKVKGESKDPRLLIYGSDITIEKYIFKTIEKLPLADLEGSLTILPFSYILRLVDYMCYWSEQGWNVSLVVRMLDFVIKQHLLQFIHTKSMKETLIRIRKTIRKNVKEVRDEVGMNLAALECLKKHWESEHEATFFADEFIEEKLSKLKVGKSIPKRKLK